MKGRFRDFPYTHTTSPLSTLGTRMVHLLQLVNLYQYIIITIIIIILVHRLHQGLLLVNPKFHGLAQVYDNVYPPSQYHTE